MDSSSTQLDLARSILKNGPENKLKNSATPKNLLILTHGSGAPMDTPFLNDIAKGLSQHSGLAGHLEIWRFNFPFMIDVLATGKRRPPNTPKILLAAWRNIINQARNDGFKHVFIGGKSLGGRMASLIADEINAAGLLCLGYPFHPPKKLDRLRTQHLIDLQTPTLICQGERDTFGNRELVKSLSLSKTIQYAWMPDGDHSFKPRVKSGQSLEGNMKIAIESIASWLEPMLEA